MAAGYAMTRADPPTPGAGLEDGVVDDPRVRQQPRPQRRVRHRQHQIHVPHPRQPRVQVLEVPAAAGPGIGDASVMLPQRHSNWRVYCPVYAADTQASGVATLRATILRSNTCCVLW